MPKRMDDPSPAAGSTPAEHPFQVLFEQNPLPSWVYDSATLAFLEVNDAAVRQYG